MTEKVSGDDALTRSGYGAAGIGYPARQYDGWRGKNVRRKMFGVRSHRYQDQHFGCLSFASCHDHITDLRRSERRSDASTKLALHMLRCSRA